MAAPNQGRDAGQGRDVSPSRGSYADAAKALESLAAKATPKDLMATGDELLAVADLLRREPRLRRALTDPTRPGADRGDLLRGLLTGKVGPASVDLAVRLAEGRWAVPSELLDGVERLGAAALLAAAERADELGEVEDELFRFGQVVAGSPELAATLSNPTAPVSQRAGLVADLLKGKARATTVRLIQIALAGFGGRGFSASLARLVELTAAQRDRQVAYVTSAMALSDEEEARLGGRLSQMYGRQISLKVTVDRRIIGGLRVQVGSDLYDGTVLRRLTQARTAVSR